jgi:hypothetical protein
VPEFLMPPPLSATPEPAGELARVRATPAAQIRRDLSLTYRSSLPPGLEPLYNRPAAGIDALVRLLHAYWERALADHWPRMRAMLDADVGYRTSALGVGGSRAALGGLHELVGLDGNDLLVGAQGDEPEQCVDVGGEGLLLLPSIFAWPSVATMLRSPWPPALIYPSRGMGRLWHVGGPSSGPASLQPWRRSCSWGSISSSAASWRGCSPGTSS